MKNKLSPLFFISAGEASGDLHGAHLVKAVKEMAPHARFLGMGGKKMAEAGVELVAHISEMSVVGFTEVMSHLKVILFTMQRLKRAIKEHRPDLVILIDYPDFHLPLARFAKREGLKIMYYISPQIWAWRKGRVKTIKKFIDHMVVILPFEEKIYRDAGVKCTFVGHPLLDITEGNLKQEDAKNTLGFPVHARIIAILPGSRKKEVTRLLPVMLEAATLLKKSYLDAFFILPYADTLDPSWIESIVASYETKVTLVPGHMIHQALAASDFAIVASGTATLETALMGVPMCIVYRLSFFTYLLGRLAIRVKNIGLVNIIAGKTLVPELIQKDCTPERIAITAKTILDDPVKVSEIREGLKEVKEKLGTPGAARKTALIALKMVGYGNF
ncbi:MAG: lipid-A-disaccharide synthase [Syntrophales bacterium]|nr:lipid-A-disaccharide synthase [Syntrophales bacterium]